MAVNYKKFERELGKLITDSLRERFHHLANHPVRIEEALIQDDKLGFNIQIPAIMNADSQPDIAATKDLDAAVLSFIKGASFAWRWGKESRRRNKMVRN